MSKQIDDGGPAFAGGVNSAICVTNTGAGCCADGQIVNQALSNGIYYELPADEYFAVEALSSSGAGQILKTPAHYLLSRTQEDEDTKQKTRGSASHAAILQPEIFRHLYACGPDVDLRTKAGKASWESFVNDCPPDVIHIRGAEWPLIQGIREAVWAHPIARQLLECDGPREASLIWTYAGTGYPMKARVDLPATPLRTIVDLKCLRDIRADEFAKAIYARGYHRQGATYQHGTAAHNLFFDTTAFIAVENEPPHCVIVYELEEEAIETGWADMRAAAEIYARCKRSGEWPGFPCEIQKIGLPKWARSRDESILSI